MNSRVRVSKSFKRQAKPLLKKYPSLRDELRELQTILHENPAHGIPLGNDVFKIRLAVKSKGRGKSGGLRVITFLESIVIAQADEKVVNLISIYDKSELENLTDAEIQRLLDTVEFDDE
ncbi:MAG: hypothetical protein ACK4Q5_00800 [Saprospiraceae bacterium]